MSQVESFPITVGGKYTHQVTGVYVTVTSLLASSRVHFLRDGDKTNSFTSPEEFRQTYVPRVVPGSVWSHMQRGDGATVTGIQGDRVFFRWIAGHNGTDSERDYPEFVKRFRYAHGPGVPEVVGIAPARDLCSGMIPDSVSHGEPEHVKYDILSDVELCACSPESMTVTEARAWISIAADRLARARGKCDDEEKALDKYRAIRTAAIRLSAAVSNASVRGTEFDETEAIANVKEAARIRSDLLTEAYATMYGPNL